MMASGRPISEEDLHGFVDGRLDAGRASAVEQYLHNNPDAAARIRGWQASRSAVQALHGGADREPIPAALDVRRLMIDRQTRHWAPARVAAGLALALCVGAATGWFAHQPPPATGLAALGVEAVDAHRVFSGNPVQAVEFAPDALAGQLGRIGRFVGHPVAVPDLSASGYRLLGARLVATPQGAGCLFLYDGALGRVSILMRSMHDADVNAPMRSVGSPGYAGFAWARRGLGVGVVADAPPEELRQLSDRVGEAMPSAI